jgi:hypothetical protein
MLGLDSYRAALEAGSSETGADAEAGAWDGAEDGTVADQRSPQSLGAEAAFDADMEAGADAVTETQGQGVIDAADASADAIIGEDAVIDSTDGNNLPEAADGQTSDGLPDVATDQQPSDAAADAAFDQQAPDSAADGNGCPAQCNGGCGNGGNVCTIVISQPSTGPVVCPYGLGCQVQCVGTQVCVQTIVCPVSQPCTVVCNGDQACDSNVISGAGATSLCVDCSKGTGGNGNPGCNSVTCTGTCSIHCQGSGCNTSCGNCSAVPACP